LVGPVAVGQLRRVAGRDVAPVFLGRDAVK
jgi:hypothetical protein